MHKKKRNMLYPNLKFTREMKPCEPSIPIKKESNLCISRSTSKKSALVILQQDNKNKQMARTL